MVATTDVEEMARSVENQAWDHIAGILSQLSGQYETC